MLLVSLSVRNVLWGKQLVPYREEVPGALLVRFILTAHVLPSLESCETVNIKADVSVRTKCLSSPVRPPERRYKTTGSRLLLCV
jgi:hypothetical protein